VKVFTKKNAIVGYATIKALEKRAAKAARKERKRRPRLPLYFALGLVSFGILAAVAAYASRRRSSEVIDETQPEVAPPLEETAEVMAEEASELVEAAAEPTPAT
jgi:hypothetical protein